MSETMDPVAASLRARYVSSFAEKRASIDAAFRAIALHPGAKVDLRLMCHKLAGSAPMYQFDELGAAARNVCLDLELKEGSGGLDTLVSKVLEILDRRYPELS